MDDLLDLNWTAPPPNTTKQQAPKAQRPKDAFADLLGSSSKSPDVSKLSLNQQRTQQSANTSPWLTPVQASTPRSLTPVSSNSIPNTFIQPKSSLFTEPKRSTTTTSSSSFEDMLNPFGSSPKNSKLDKNTPLNQLRNQTDASAIPSNTNQWDFDLLDSHMNNSTKGQSPSISHDTIDPFDMDSLLKESKKSSASISENNDAEENEDDNPLGVLAHPTPVKKPTPSSPVTHHSPVLSHSQNGLIISEDQEDAMVAQLIDMGFSLRESKFAIEATGGNDLQSAIDLLVQNSETVTRQQATLTQRKAETTQNDRARQALFSKDTQQQPTDALQQQTEKIVNQAQELGGFLYKNATSFLKTGREKVTKAVGDWQEQQKATRTREEQGASARPRWMTEGDETVQASNDPLEKFADDDDSEEEGDPEAERKRIQEMRKAQVMKQREAAAAHKARQQQNMRKEALIQDEGVYVSPSRRRANTPSSSARSTPKSNGSPIQQQQRINPLQQKQSTPEQRSTSLPQSPLRTERKRTRPIVQASPQVMIKVNEARSHGNEKFKLGQFGEAEESYTRAIDMLPTGHDHLVLLSSNRAMTRLKIGNYKKCVEDCDVAIDMAKESGEGSCQSEGVVIQWRDQIVKSLYRKADALENLEKYKEALSTYDELVKLEGTNNSKVNQGMSRCRNALNPKKAATPKETKQNLTFDASPKKSPQASREELDKSKAVSAMRAKAAEQEAEDAEKLEKTDHINARLLAWKTGKEQNLRALLATLDTLLWPGAQWKGSQLSDLVNPKKCKIVYMKAISKVHPDKLPSDATVEQKMLASGIFGALNEAWDSFKAQNQM